MSLGYIWIVDDDDAIRWVLEKALTTAGYQCQSYQSALDIIEPLAHSQPDVLITDIRMPNMDGLTLLQHIKEQYPELPVIITTAYSDLDTTVSAYQKGAFDYLPKPFDIDEVLILVNKAILVHKEKTTVATPKSQIANKLYSNNGNIIGESAAMQEIYRIIGRLSRSSINILLNGESGTGKELVAQALHQHSPRANKPFIALNMAAIPKELIESELFGHEKGAFTGANQLRHGRFEQANGGTLFLDEIGDMPLEIQTRLLRVLSDGQFYRVGGYSALNVDVRIIAATHQNLEKLVQQHAFREDLFYRLNVIRIMLPPLRDRHDDIPLLIQHFLQKAAQELNASPKALHPKTLAQLSKLRWPGNVRQLENLCRWLTIMVASQEVMIHDLPNDLLQQTSYLPNTSNNWLSLLTENIQHQLKSEQPNILTETITTVEKIIFQEAIRFTQGHRQEAARKLGCGRNTLSKKLKELNLE